MKILNFGSLNIDHVYQVPHFVRAGETLGAISLARHAGGKGLNQSVALARAGARVAHAGCMGADGDFLLELLRENGVDVSGVRRIGEPTGHAVIQVEDGGQNSILLYGGANRCVDADWIDRVLSSCDKGDLLLAQNEISHLAYLLEAAHRRGMIVALNPSPIDDSLKEAPLAKVDWFLLNRLEAEALAGMGTVPQAERGGSGETGEAALREAEKAQTAEGAAETEKTEAEAEAEAEAEEKRLAARLCARYPQASFVMTLGERGAVCFGRAGECRMPAVRVRAVDTTGAGDTFTGYFLAAWSAGEPLVRCMERASRAAALAVTRPGAAESIPYAREI